MTVIETSKSSLYQIERALRWKSPMVCGLNSLLSSCGETIVSASVGYVITVKVIYCILYMSIVVAIDNLGGTVDYIHPKKMFS